jgi:hypothetical protein
MLLRSLSDSDLVRTQIHDRRQARDFFLLVSKFGKAPQLHACLVSSLPACQGSSVANLSLTTMRASLKLCQWCVNHPGKLDK